jgi:RIO kinase 1
MAVNKSREAWKIYANVFDSYTLNLLRKLSGQGYFEELENPIALGKEANVFTARKKDNSYVIVKIYRLENCNFNKMLDYLKQDERYYNVKRNKRNIVFNWVQREYRNLMFAREVIKVPTPIVCKDNILVMELIGDPIAPQLKNRAPKNSKTFMNNVLKQIKLLWKKGLVHGDLSAFNILNDDEKPIFIDFSQGTLTKSGDASDLLKRDLKNINTFFKKLEVSFDEEKVFQDIVK